MNITNNASAVKTAKETSAIIRTAIRTAINIFYSLLERTARAIADSARTWTTVLVAESDRARTMDATINSIESRGRIRKERSQRMKLVI
jgi:hypothetical protein